MAKTEAHKVYEVVEYVILFPKIICPKKNYFESRTVEAVVANVLAINPKATIILKSTFPVGYTEKVREIFDTENIIFSLEFLR